MDSKTKILYYVQDLEFRFYPWPISKLAYLFCKWTYATKNLIPANGYIEKSLNDLGFDTLRSPGLGVADYFIDEPKSEVHKTIDVVIFIRRGRHKNLRESYRIVRSLRMLGLTVCAIAPESSLIRPLEGVIEEWKINPSEGEILLALDSARLMLLTSKHEGFSLPPLEAMARGLPVVMFSCGGPLEYAENKKNALISGYGDSDDLVNNIQYLLDDMNLYERLSKNAESTARKYRLSNSIKKTVRLINTCLQTL